MKVPLFALPSAAAPLLALLLALPSLGESEAHASEALYRWSEPDGSLTYSPKAPTDGTPYDIVDPMTLRPAPDGEAEGITKPTPPADVRTADVRTADVRTTAAQPPTDASELGRPVRAVTSPPSGPGAARPSTAAATSQAPASLSARGADVKERRCEELEKRVVSLERRLRAVLTPEAMDDTVMQMARYQRNVERHCR